MTKPARAPRTPAKVVQLRKGTTLEMVRLACPDAAQATRISESFGLPTRHKIDACIVAERNRLEAAAQKRQPDIRKAPTEAGIRERLFTEARSYAEKANVADYAEDRIEFARTGKIRISRDPEPLNVRRVALTARRILEAAREISTGASINIPVWRLVDSARQIGREIGDRVNEVVRSVRSRIENRAKAHSVSREWDLGH